VGEYGLALEELAGYLALAVCEGLRRTPDP
jgi:hypothetical protein